MDTGVLTNIWVHATENTAAPTMPAVGSDLVEATMTTAGWVALPGELADKGYKPELVKDDATDIKAPTKPLKTKKIRYSQGVVDAINLLFHDVGKEIFAFATNRGADGIVVSPDVHTRCTVLVEMGGRMAEHYHSCDIVVYSPTADDQKSPFSQEARIEVYGKTVAGVEVGSPAGTGCTPCFFTTS